MNKQRILLIDDEVTLCRFVKLNLEQTGEFEVTVAHSGEEGLQKAQAAQFDLVITDFKMPGMDGAAVVTALKAMKPRAPVVLFSIYYDDPDTVPSQAVKEADGILSKPFKHEKLYEEIRRVLPKTTRTAQNP